MKASKIIKNIKNAIVFLLVTSLFAIIFTLIGFVAVGFNVPQVVMYNIVGIGVVIYCAIAVLVLLFLADIVER